MLLEVITVSIKNSVALEKKFLFREDRQIHEE